MESWLPSKTEYKQDLDFVLAWKGFKTLLQNLYFVDEKITEGILFRFCVYSQTNTFIFQ